MLISVPLTSFRIATVHICAERSGTVSPCNFLLGSLPQRSARQGETFAGFDVSDTPICQSSKHQRQ
jgi:hypothetical protein